LALAGGLATGWSGARRIHPVLPILGASTLAVLAVVMIASPPSAEGLLATSSDPLANTLAAALTNALRPAASPAWGIWIAASGATMALVGAIADPR
jgi:hypothetical protein